MKRLRAKKTCGKCQYLADFPHVHCTLGCELRHDKKSPNIFVTIPKHKDRCTERRQRQLIA